ncbi:MAG TPA: hypothetical protein VL098_03930 [Flavipsychrobacter sp.]|nr:hypothetical protein [Flavipsychrobacter sp.]
MSEQQTEQRLEMNDLRQLVVFVRHKAPTAGLGGELAAAEGMVSKVTGAVEAATSAVESAMAAIPGLNMIIKESKKESTSEDKYNYFEKYASWDTVIDTTEDVLTDMNPESKIYKYEYESTDAAGRRDDAQTLLNEIKSQITGWRRYTAHIHFVALSDGGNIANECVNLIADDSNFSNERWTVKTIIYVGTPLYKNTHVLNKQRVPGVRTFYYGNRYDFTQRAVGYFEPNAKLIQQVKDANKGTLSLFIGKIKMHMVQALAVLLKGVHLGNTGSGQSPSQLFNGIKDEVEGLISDVVGSAKQLIGEGMGLIKPGDLPEFANMLNGYDRLPSMVVNELKQFFEDFKKLLEQRAKQVTSGSTNLGLSDLSGFLNCLCPLFDTLTNSMRLFSYGEETAAALSQQIIEGCEITTVYAPSKESARWLDVDADMIAGAAQAAANDQPDLAPVLANQINGLLTEATRRTNTVSEMNEAEKAKIAQAIYLVMTPMLPSKIDFYKKLIQAIPFNLGQLLEAINGNEYLSKITGPLGKIGIQTPERLQASVNAFDAEFKRIAGYVNKNNYKTQEKADSLYLIYNSHNLMLSKCWGDVWHCIDEQTGILAYKESQGFRNTYNTNENRYERQGDTEIANNVPTQRVREEEGATT